MASYINGITTYIPEIQPSDVNLQIESQYAGFRKQKNDAARQQLSQLYGSLLNSPLSRQDNIEARDKFFETIEGQIKKISGMDLSLDQNAYQASQVFNQLLDDKYILKDMSWTKNYENQVLASQYLKNGCTDPEQCGGEWWSGGDRLLEYDREAFANATAEESLRFGNTQYIAKQNVTRKAMEFAKKYGVDVKTEQTNGMYIFTQKNGEAAIPLYSAMFNGMIAEDPRVMEYYNAMAKVERLDYIHTHENEFGSKEAAEQAYINEKMREMSEAKDDNGNIVATVSQDDVITKEAENARTKSQRNKDIAAGLKVTASQTQNEQQAQSLSQRADELDRESYYYDREYDRANSVITKINRDKNNGTISGEQIDAKLAWNYMNNDIGRAVLMASYMDSEMTIREDKYGLERYKASLANQNKQKQSQDANTSSMFANQRYENKLGGTQIDKKVDLFSTIKEVSSSNYQNLKKEIGDSDLHKSVINFMKSDTFKNLSDEQKQAYKAVYNNLSDIQLEQIDMSKDIIQPLFSNMNQDSINNLQKVIDDFSSLSVGEELNDDINNITEHLNKLKANYDAAYDSKELAIESANKILDNIDAYKTKNPNTEQSFNKLESLLRAYTNGKAPITTTEKMAYLNSYGYSDFVDNNTIDFYATGDNDLVKLNGGSILSLIDSGTMFNGYLLDALESQFGIEHIGNWNDSIKDFGNTLLNGLNLIPSLIGGLVDSVVYISGLDHFIDGSLYDTLHKDYSREEDYLLNGRSIFVKDDRGNRKKNTNGDYILTDEAKSVLNKSKDIYVPHDLRNSLINESTSIIRGEKDIKKSSADPGIGSYESSVNFDKLTNDFARTFGLLKYNNNDLYKFDTNGNMSTMSFDLDLTNNESMMANRVVTQFLNDASKGNMMNNIMLTSVNAEDASDAQDKNREFTDLLSEHNLSTGQFMSLMAQKCSGIARQIGTNKDGSPKFYDTDYVGLCTYSPMALGNPNYSVLQFDYKIFHDVLKDNGFKEDEIPQGLYIYNKHGQRENATDTSNGYSILDSFYVHTPEQIIIDSLNGKTYNGVYIENAINTQVARLENGYAFSSEVPESIYIDDNGKKRVKYITVDNHNSMFELNDNFNLAKTQWQETINGIYQSFLTNYYYNL